MVVRNDISKQVGLSHSEKYRKRKAKIGIKQMSFLIDKDISEILERIKKQTGVSYSDFINELVRKYRKKNVLKQKPLSLPGKKQMSFMLDKDVREIIKKIRNQTGISYSNYISRLIRMYHKEVYKSNK